MRSSEGGIRAAVGLPAGATGEGVKDPVPRAERCSEIVGASTPKRKLLIRA